MDAAQIAIGAAPSEAAMVAALRVADGYRAQIAELEQQVENLKRSNSALRIEIERLGSPENAQQAEAAAWRWATGNAQTVAVCELDGAEKWIPVLTSRAGLNAVASEICRAKYGPQWDVRTVLRLMGAGAERGSET